MAANRTSRFLLILVVALMFSIFLAGTAVSAAFAADGATITSPDNNKTYDIGKKVTVKAKATYTLVDGKKKDNFIYFKITKDGKRVAYGRSSGFISIFAPSEHTLEYPFTPRVEGAYLIEVHHDFNYVNGNHVELAYEDFVADSEGRTIIAQKTLTSANTTVSAPSVTYTGQSLTSVPTVITDGKTLDPETDYDVSYGDNNVNVGEGTFTVTGKGFYKGSVSGTFAITPADISQATMSGIVDKEYSPRGVTQTPTITWNDQVLVADTDYELSYTNNENAGTATVTAMGMGNFTGSVSSQFTINKVSICSFDLQLENKTYTGRPITQSISFWHGGNVLENEGFTTSYKDNIEPGTATVTITGIGNFKDSMTRTFSIFEPSPTTYGSAPILAPNDKTQFAVGSKITARVGATMFVTPYSSGLPIQGGWNCIYIKITKDGEKVYYDWHKIYSSSDVVELTFTPDTAGVYEIQTRWTSFNVTSSGNTGTINVIPYEDFRGTDSVTLYVGVDAPDAKTSIANAQISGVTDKYYTGNSVTQNPTVKVNGKTLNPATDYYITYKGMYSGGTNTVRHGTVTMTIHGKGKYTDTVSTTFEILQKPLTPDMIIMTPSSFTYTGEPQKPNVVLMNGLFKLSYTVDYDLDIEEGTEPGSYRVTATTRENVNYTGSATAYYTIKGIPIDQAVVTVSPTSYVYDGQAKKPTVNASLDGAGFPAELYDVTYSNNTNAGTAKATITAKANTHYEGSASSTFTISPLSITDESINVIAPGNVTYNRAAQTPAPTITRNGKALKSGTDYTLSYKNNTDAGEATVTITGKGNFKGARTATFAIARKDISSASITIDPIKYQRFEEGKPSTPQVMIKDGAAVLTSDEYEVAYANNDKVGTATVTITGKGNYSGSRNDIEFQILEPTAYAQAALSDAISEIEQEGTSQYLDDDEAAVKEAVKDAKKLIADGKATASDLEKALKRVTTAQKTAKDNLAAKQAADKAKAEKEKKEALALPTAASVAKKILAQKTDKDPANSVFAPIKLKSTKQGTNYITLKWSKVKKADKYVIYGNKCGKTSKIKKIATVTKNTYKNKKLKKGKYYKYVVVAVADTAVGERAVAVSKMIHVATTGGKVGNSKSITVKVKSGKKVSKTTTKATVKKGKSVTLLTTVKPASAKLKVKTHVKPRFETSNAKIVKVSSKGVVKAVGKGTCYVYAYTQSGTVVKLKVTVK